MKKLYEKIKEIESTANAHGMITIYKDFKVNTGLYSKTALRIFNTIFSSTDERMRMFTNDSLLIQNSYFTIPKIGERPLYTFLNDDGEIYFIVRMDRTMSSNKASDVEVLLIYDVMQTAYDLASRRKLQDIEAVDIERLSNALSGYDDSLNDPPACFTKSDEEVYEEYKDLFGCPFNPVQYAAYKVLNDERQQLAQKCSDYRTSAADVIKMHKKLSYIYDEIMNLCE